MSNANLEAVPEIDPHEPEAELTPEPAIDGSSDASEAPAREQVRKRVHR